MLIFVSIRLIPQTKSCTETLHSGLVDVISGKCPSFCGNYKTSECKLYVGPLAKCLLEKFSNNTENQFLIKINSISIRIEFVKTYIFFQNSQHICTITIVLLTCTWYILTNINIINTERSPNLALQTYITCTGKINNMETPTTKFYRESECFCR